MLEAVRQKGLALKHVAPEHKSDGESLLEAGKQEGHASEHATPGHKAGSFVVKVVKQYED